MIGHVAHANKINQETKKWQSLHVEEVGASGFLEVLRVGVYQAGCDVAQSV